MASPIKVCIVGSGNWGSVIGKIVGENVAKSERFDRTVSMWVFEEMVSGRKLTEIINTDHENVKYLPGYKLPANVLAVPDLLDAARDADILVFVVPHQFIRRTCDELKGHIKSSTIGVSLIKGVDVGLDGLKLISDIIREMLGIEVSVLMGANLASEVAAEKFCESTIGSANIAHGKVLKELLQTQNFRIRVVAEADTVEICGALKNVVAVGAGFCDGLGCGDNTKAAVIRLGLMEMVAFARLHCKGPVLCSTFLESCGVADLITTCYGGRNRKIAEAFTVTGKTIEQLEQDMLNGQKLQGPQTAVEIHQTLKLQNLVDKFPLFTAVYQICYECKPVSEFVQCLQNHPEHK
ncbi:glycerol-3-phosphate dehydrogenase [NAD(+)], cytoplasmic-like isoform X1 [Scyliorhinus canicula]|uniref:glycerol-3-phosphate dehydrogenase [NAD(+)], cytoplasmic-like isoform X1 n=2 Tax=Scyliorhinus canicula TaxID=7830 RepID=UPI0018F41E96|nr:glycerol-3-phosphate dehydrogenase [NAD(+)], cytoplasmic-like isoform X1 [Scyliorhinus canicula]